LGPLKICQKIVTPQSTQRGPNIGPLQFLKEGGTFHSKTSFVKKQGPKFNPANFSLKIIQPHCLIGNSCLGTPFLPGIKDIILKFEFGI